MLFPCHLPAPAAPRSLPSLQAVLLMSVSKGALSALALSPPAAAAKGCSAKEWVATSIAPSGGKGGGSASRAQGASRDGSAVDKCMEEGKAFAAAKL